MKIKVKPEDFIVNEEAKISFRKRGKYKVYLLTKRNFNTVDVLIKLSKKLRVPLCKFSYGGRKDKYGLTTQYITVEGRKVDYIKEKSFEIKYIGDAERPMGPDLILSNEFKITIRDLDKKEIEKSLDSLEFIKNYGFPNYFDDQRFGSYSPQQGFFAEKLIRKEFNGAIKIYLTAIYLKDKKEEKLRKRFFWENWGNWSKCLEKTKTNFEKKAFKMLSRERKESFLKIINLIPQDEMSMFFSAYQAYLWNILVERLIRVYSRDLVEYKGNYWSYIFYDSKETFLYLKDLSLPFASSKTKMPDELTDKIYKEILKERGIKPSYFNLRKFRKVYFKPTQRKAIIVPQIKNFSISDDEIYRGKSILYLNFSLPRGSYATMLIKRLMAN